MRKGLGFHNNFVITATPSKAMSNQTPEVDLLTSKQIARLLANLPDKHLLLLTQTIDQFHLWLLHRFTYTAVAAVWVAQREGQDDPIKPFLESGQLCENDYNRIWGLVDYYQRLWELVYRVEPFVREELTKAKVHYPFQHPYELFVCILREQTSNEFSYCLSSYQEFSGTKQEKRYRQLAKFLDGEPLTKQQEKSLHVSPTEAKVKKHIWSMLLLAIAQQKATQRRAPIKNALKGFYAALAQVFEYEATHCRIQGSYAWFDGEKVKGSRKGTYQKPKP
jgi:hypothetical protein